MLMRRILFLQFLILMAVLASQVYGAEYTFIKIVDKTTVAPAGTFDFFNTPSIAGNVAAFRVLTIITNL